MTPEESILGRVLFHMPEVLSYFAVMDNVPVSCGQMAIHNGVASCFGDSTLIAYRDEARMRRSFGRGLLRLRPGAAT